MVVPLKRSGICFAMNWRCCACRVFPITPALTPAVPGWRRGAGNTAKNTPARIRRKCGLRHRVDTTGAGRKQGKNSLRVIRFAKNAKSRAGMWPRRMWIMWSRIAVTRRCFGIRVTGRRYATAAIPGRRRRRMSGQCTGTDGAAKRCKIASKKGAPTLLSFDCLCIRLCGF